MEEYGLTSASLWRICKKYDPGLTWGQETLKHPLTAAQKADRLCVAGQLLHASMDSLLSTVWIDESQVPLRIQPARVMRRRGMERLRVDPRMQQTSELHGHLHYLLAVNANMGLVHFAVLTRSPGHKARGIYKVSISGTETYSFSHRTLCTTPR